MWWDATKRQRGRQSGKQHISTAPPWLSALTDTSWARVHTPALTWASLPWTNPFRDPIHTFGLPNILWWRVPQFKHPLYREGLPSLCCKPIDWYFHWVSQTVRSQWSFPGYPLCTIHFFFKETSSVFLSPQSSLLYWTQLTCTTEEHLKISVQLNKSCYIDFFVYINLQVIHYPQLNPKMLKNTRPVVL